MKRINSEILDTDDGLEEFYNGKSNINMKLTSKEKYGHLYLECLEDRGFEFGN